MHPSRLVALLPLLTFIAQPGAVQAQEVQVSALSNKQQGNYAYAVQSFRGQHFAAAYARFAELGDAGHVPSAQMALLMYRNGPAMFGNDWSATIAQQMRWNALVINNARNRFDYTDNDRGD